MSKKPIPNEADVLKENVELKQRLAGVYTATEANEVLKKLVAHSEQIKAGFVQLQAFADQVAAVKADPKGLELAAKWQNAFELSEAGRTKDQELALRTIGSLVDDLKTARSIIRTQRGQLNQLKGNQ